MPENEPLASAPPETLTGEQLRNWRLNRLAERAPECKPEDIARLMIAASDLLVLTMSYYWRTYRDRKETEEMKEMRAALKACGLTTWSYKEFLVEYRAAEERFDQQLRDRQKSS
jgi:hypothetical protein